MKCDKCGAEAPQPEELRKDAALAVLREIIGECETKPGPFWSHVAIPKELYRRAWTLVYPERVST